jgi:hypothetical protein
MTPVLSASHKLLWGISWMPITEPNDWASAGSIRRKRLPSKKASPESPPTHDDYMFFVASCPNCAVKCGNVTGTTSGVNRKM